MSKRTIDIKVYLLLGAVFVLAAGYPQKAFPQEVEPDPEPASAWTVPEALRIPQRMEAPRLPRDMVVGELGQGQAPESAHRFAQGILTALSQGNRTAPVMSGSLPALSQDIFTEIADLAPRNFRLGGGRNEVDGSVSFLVRFVGREESITGELFLRQTAPPGETEDAPPEDSGAWFVEELILEERRALTEIRDSYRFDFSPYERFF